MKTTFYLFPIQQEYFLRPLNFVDNPLPWRLLCGPQFQVLLSVICSVSVEMMHVFLVSEWARQKGLHDFSVLPALS